MGFSVPNRVFTLQTLLLFVVVVVVAVAMCAVHEAPFRACSAGTEGESTVPFRYSFAYKNGCLLVLKRSETVTLYGGTERNRSNRTGS